MKKTNSREKIFKSKSKIWSLETTIHLPKHSEKKSDTTRYTFDLGTIGARFKEPVSELIISVAQHYSTAKKDIVKNIVQSLKDIRLISRNDCILHTHRSKVLEIGVVVEKEINEVGNLLSFEVRWLVDVSNENYIIDQKEDLKFQKLGPINIYAVLGDNGKTLELSLANLGLVTEDDVLYEHTKFSGKFEVIGDLENYKEEKGGLAKIFFATNRCKLSDGKANYGNQLSDELIYGFCEVSIPRGHIQGNLERPKSIWFYDFPEQEDKHFVIKKIEEKNTQEFDETLAEWFELSDEKVALIFIHGFNTTFEEAARRTGQLAWDIPFGGPTGFFSWPSSGALASYGADEEKSESSASDFSNFLMKIVNSSGIERVHIIAHSMGSRVLSFSLSQLIHETEFQKKAHIIQHLVLGAPDIDQENFKKNVLPFMNKIGFTRTIYSSDKDKAMIASHAFRGGRPRLGEAGPSIFVEDGIDTIEASNMPSKNINHNYIFEAKEILTDLFYLLTKSMKPAERRLRAVPKGKLLYWLFLK